MVVVADAAEILVLLRQQPQPEILRDIGVLVLVDQDVAKALLVVGGDLRPGLQDGEVVQQQVAEVDRVHSLQALLIGLVEREQLAVGDVADLAARNLVGDQAAILPALDAREDHPRRPALVVDALGRSDLLHQAQLVVGVEDGEIGLQADHLGMAAQDAGGDGMEGAEPEPLGGLADDALEPKAHLGRRLVGEGDGDDLRRPGAATRKDVCESCRQHASLAGAGAGEDQHRALDCLDRLALRLVEIGEIGRHGGTGRKRRRRCGFKRIGHYERSIARRR